MYTGHLAHTIKMRCKDHAQHIQIFQPDKLMVAKHQRNIKDITILARMTGYMTA
jgi:hypothetical protein